MTKEILLYLVFAFLISCSGNVSDPKTDVPNGTGLSYRPEITMYNFKGSEAYRAGGTYKINFKVVDEVLGVNENVIEYKRDSDANWTLVQDKVLSSSNKLVQVVWNIPNDLTGNNFKLRITAYGKIPATKQAESLSTFVIDGTRPTLGSGGFTSVPLPAGNPFQFLKLMSVAGDQDDLSGVGAYCLGTNANEVDQDDSCWVNKTLLSSSSIPVFAGVLSQTFTPYLHIRDRAKNARLNTDTDTDDKITLNQTVVTIPTASDAFYKASSSADTLRRLNLTIQNTSASYNYSNFPNNNTQSIDPGLVAYLPNGSLLIRDRVSGLRKVDLIQMCGAEPCSVLLAGTASAGADGLLDGTAKLVEPLRMQLSKAGVLWLLDRKSAGSSELVVKTIDFNLSQPKLTTVVGGGTNESDSISSALDLKITYSEGLVFYGAFQSLPNGWLVFHSNDPEAALNTADSLRYRLRLFKPGESKQVQTLYLETKNIFDISKNSGKDLLATSSPAITFDEDYQDIKSVYFRTCELVLPIKSAQSCTNSKILGFDKSGSAQVALQLADYAFGGNLVLESPNGKDVFAKSGLFSEFRKYNSTSNTWEVLAGNGSWGSGYCLNGIANSACSLRLKDAFLEPSLNLLFVVDQSKIRIITPDLNKIYSLVE